MFDPKRRDTLRRLAGTAGIAALGAGPWIVRAATHFAHDPFSLGVASGYPTPSGVVLWTRLAPEPLARDGGMSNASVSVSWEVARDEQFRQVARRGVAHAESRWAHSVHVEVEGLEPGREYWYRFRAGDARSPAGRTHTAPRAGDSIQRLRLAIASCQQYEHGYFVAYRRMLEDQPDVIVHVGDYIYELSWGDNLVRSHGSGECRSLADYRARYALYRSDADLAAAHAACPWLVTWDDHEVDNDYGGLISENNDDPQTFAARRAAAYRAYYEHMPLPMSMAPTDSGMRLYTTSTFGDLVSVDVLDERQYRSAPPCRWRNGALNKRVRAEECPELDSTAATMLGTTQEEWLGARLAKSRARWNLLAQGVVMTYVTEARRPARYFWTDSWNGYPAARARLMQQLRTAGASNPVVLSGDIHSFVAADLYLDPADPATPCVGSELVTSSLTSQPPDEGLLRKYREFNPNVRLATGKARGYLRLDVSPGALQADLVAMDTVRERDSGTSVLASFAIEAGEPGLKP